MAKKMVNMPQSSAGITNYTDEEDSLFHVSPVGVIMFIILMVLLIVVLHIIGKNLVGV